METHRHIHTMRIYRADGGKEEEPELGKLFLKRWCEKKAETEAFAGHEEEKDSGPRTKEQLLASQPPLRTTRREGERKRERERERIIYERKRGKRGTNAQFRRRIR